MLAVSPNARAANFPATMAPIIMPTPCVKKIFMLWHCPRTLSGVDMSTYTWPLTKKKS